MARSIDTKRLYRVMLVTVVTTSVIFLFLASINYQQAKESRKKWRTCYQVGEGGCLIAWRKPERRSKQYLKVGIALPIIFFGSNALLNYVAPKKEGNANG